LTAFNKVQGFITGFLAQIIYKSESIFRMPLFIIEIPLSLRDIPLIKGDKNDGFLTRQWLSLIITL